MDFFQFWVTDIHVMLEIKKKRGGAYTTQDFIERTNSVKLRPLHYSYTTNMKKWVELDGDTGGIS